MCNDGDGVVVRLLEEPSQFIAALYQDCPPLARIDSVEHASLVWERAPTDFTIRQSAGGSMNTQIVPDAATCPACLAEMNTGRAALPLSFHQLHPLRTTLHHYSRYAL